MTSLPAHAFNHSHHNRSSQTVDALTYLVASLPLESHLPESDMHDVVVGLWRVTHLTDDVALLHHSVAFVFKFTDGAADGLHGALSCCCVWERRQKAGININEKYPFITSHAIVSVKRQYITAQVVVSVFPLGKQPSGGGGGGSSCGVGNTVLSAVIFIKIALWVLQKCKDFFFCVSCSVHVSVWLCIRAELCYAQYRDQRKIVKIRPWRRNDLVNINSIKLFYSVISNSPLSNIALSLFHWTIK